MSEEGEMMEIWKRRGRDEKSKGRREGKGKEGGSTGSRGGKGGGKDRQRRSKKKGEIEVGGGRERQGGEENNKREGVQYRWIHGDTRGRKRRFQAVVNIMKAR